jgi:hypothetical protein
VEGIDIACGDGSLPSPTLKVSDLLLYSCKYGLQHYYVYKLTVFTQRSDYVTAEAGAERLAVCEQACKQHRESA